jgi:D-alanyl-lipoteichoic acid acyltransferase DltB (MBOAT superfamily)
MGLRQALWGFFKKVVIADRCAMVVDHIFERPDAFSGPLLFVGLFLFAWQIYCDFSGYSDIAIGTARLFGFRLMTNFKTPYFSRDIAEFWRRWHISLSTWFRDYLYIPLGGSRGGRLRRFRNVAIIFTVSGLWHGANWTFVCWGALHALFFLPLLLSGRNRRHLDTVAEGRRFPSFGEALRVVGTFLLTTAAWAFFRSRTLGQAVAYLGRMVCTMGTPTAFGEVPGGRYGLLLTLLFIFFVAAFEWVHRAKRDPSDWGGPRWSRWCFYVILVNLLLFFGVFERMEFIYFQF